MENKQIVVIFEVTPTKEGKVEYLRIAEQLKKELAGAEGFVSAERFESLTNEGKLLSLNVWESEEALSKWRNNASHRAGQKAGYDSFFESYNIRVTKVMRDYSMENREQAPEDSNQLLVKI